MPLFNGKDLTGWKQDTSGKGGWSVTKRGELLGVGVPSKVGDGWAAIATERADIKDFRIRAVVQNSDDKSKQFWLRNGPSGKNVYSAYGVSVGGTKTGSGDTVPIGSLTRKSNQANTYQIQWDKPAQIVDVPTGMWYTLEVEIVGGRVRSFINGKQIAELNDDQPLPSGEIRLVCRTDTNLNCKEISICEIIPISQAEMLLKDSKEARQKLEAITPPKDLSQWGDAAKPSGTWKLEAEDVLVGSGWGGMTFPRGLGLTDLYMKLEASAAPNSHGGVVLRRRVRPLPNERDSVHTGYYVPIVTSNPPRIGTISRWRNIREDAELSPSSVKECVPEKWYRFEIVAVGSKIAVFVDGNFASYWVESSDDPMMLYKEGIPTFRV